MPKPDGTSAFDQRYNEALVAAAKRAVANLQPVRIAAGEGRSRVAMSRRQVQPADVESTLTFDENHVSQSFGKEKTDTPVKLKEFGGVVRLGANPTGPIDDAVQLVRIDDMAGKPIAVMIHYACHGTSLGGRNTKVSGEWMGRMQAHAEKQIPGLGAMFVQGAAGDINPRVVGGLDGHKRRHPRHLGARRRDRRRSGSRLPATRPAADRSPNRTGQPRKSNCLAPIASCSRISDNTVVRAPTTVVRIGPLMWVSFPGELFSAIGKQVKAACPAPYAHLMGYTNGSIGYFPTQAAFSQGGYEPATSHLDPTAEPIYMREIAAMLKNFP